MTKQLYLPLPYQRSWEATVMDTKTIGKRTQIITHETIFIPTTTGGPPMDRGSIEGIPIHRIFVFQDQIIHELAGKLETPPATVHMELDWPTRRRTLDAQTALLLFGLLVERQLTLHLRGFHASRGELLIDTTKGRFTPSMVHTLEDALQHMIEAAIPITGQWISPKDAERYPLRQGTWAKAPQWITSLGDDHIAGSYAHHQNTAHLGQLILLDVTEESHHLRWHLRAGDEARAHEQDSRRVLHHLESLWDTDDVLKAAHNLMADTRRLRQDMTHWIQYLLRDAQPQTPDDRLFTATYCDLPLSAAEAITEELKSRYPVVCWQLVHDDESRLYWHSSPELHLSLTAHLQELSRTFRFVAQGHDEAMTILVPTPYGEELMNHLTSWAQKQLETPDQPTKQK